MKICTSLLFTLVLAITSCTPQTGSKEKQYAFTNELINQSSPYLLQHAHNPVNWYPWSKEALSKARAENKLIIVSIGYAACHWCHVMEHESFEDPEVAALMKEHFISIKVDREERPDVDQVYMNAVQLLTGSGGWPLNCITLPDGRPIYCGTYFPKERWMEMLSKVSEFVKNNPEKAEKQAEALTRGVRANELIQLSTSKESFSKDELNQVFRSWKSHIDFSDGGFSKAPKFPMPVGFQFLLQYYYHTGDPKSLEAVTTTLDKMADGGIYDQIGGGFSRYSTDGNWKVPHFEKMLYDNAQLVSLYAAAFQLTKNPKYKAIVVETLAFIRRELTSDGGSFYSSLDADSEGEEGRYYVWTADEIKNALGDQASLLTDYYNMTDKGNWENGDNILYKSGNGKQVAGKFKITEMELAQRISKSKSTLLQERSKRVRPPLDDKSITSWNALMIKGYVDAYRVLDDIGYLEAAVKNATLINSKLKSADGRLSRTFKNDKATINGFLDDYAFTIEAFISLYQATFDERWLTEAHTLTEYAIAHFFDKESGMFYYTSDEDPALIVRKMEVNDQVIPASNSTMAKNLFVLGKYLYRDDFIQKSNQMLLNVREDALKGGVYYANWDILLAWFTYAPYEVAIIGGNHESLRKEFDKHYLPNVLLSGGPDDGELALHENKLIPGQTTIYVCENKICKRPTQTTDEALKQISQH